MHRGGRDDLLESCKVVLITGIVNIVLSPPMNVAPSVMFDRSVGRLGLPSVMFNSRVGGHQRSRLIGGWVGQLDSVR